MKNPTITLNEKLIEMETARLKKEYEELGRRIEACEFNWAKTNIRIMTDAMEAISTAKVVIQTIEDLNGENEKKLNEIWK